MPALDLGPLGRMASKIKDVAAGPETHIRGPIAVNSNGEAKQTALKIRNGGKIFRPSVTAQPFAGPDAGKTIKRGGGLTRGAQLGLAATGGVAAGAGAVETKNQLSKAVDVHKAFSDLADPGPTPPSTGRRIAAGLTGPLHPLVRGKKGKKLRGAGAELAGEIGGGVAGTLADVGVGVASRGKVRTRGIGGTAGGILGIQAALNHNQRRGYLKPEKES